MSQLSRAIAACLILFHAPSMAVAQAVEICHDIHLSLPIEDELDETETRTVCGFSDARGTRHQAWQSIPRPQAVLALQAALQKRGYHKPKFHEEGRVLRVDPGEKTHVRSTKAIGAPIEFDLQGSDQFVNEVLTPDLLDDLEKWSKESLQDLGYPCPEVASAADPETGDVVLNVNPGEKTIFGPVRVVGATEDIQRNLKRFYSFAPDDVFDREDLQVSRYRLLQYGLVEKTEFTPECGARSPGVLQTVVNGDPWFVGLSFGFNTEEIVRLNLRFRAPRIGRHGSAFEASLFASRQVQQVDVFGEWFDQGESRKWIEPRATLLRRDEEHFEDLYYQLMVARGISWDLWRNAEAKISVGPAMARYETKSGPGPETATEFSARLRASVQSHSSLVYDPDRRHGYYLELALASSDESWGSDFSATRMEVLATKIWQVGSAGSAGAPGPSDFSVGLRGQAFTIWTPHREVLPAGSLAYAGGFSELRGFERLTLPEDGQGGLTKAVGTLELHTSHLMPQNWTPAIFVDVGVIGQETAEFRAPFYWSPGAGLNWYSPVGTVRASIANGRVDGALPDGESIGTRSRWQIYLGWGELF